MSVIFYDVGEHGGGFVGYRAVTTVGKDGALAQRYFSLNDYSKETARNLAYAFNDEYRQKAQINRKEARLNSRGKSITSVVSGIATTITCERKKSNGHTYWYFVPKFVVSTGKTSRSVRKFGISGNVSYELAYSKAVENFCSSLGYGKTTKFELLDMIPKKEIFYFSYKRLWKAGHDISIEEVLDRLQISNFNMATVKEMEANWQAATKKTRG